jgi:hypothetical protein
MTEINIKDLQLKIDKNLLMEFIKSQQFFEIDCFGSLHAFNHLAKTVPVIFRNEKNIELESNSTNEIIYKVFQKEYKPIIEDDIVQITPLGAWQDIIALNRAKMSYFDHQTDGVEVFEDAQLEEIGWQATALDITYRQLCSHLEQTCEGVFMFYDNGMHFNGFVILKNLQQAKDEMINYVVQTIKEKSYNQDDLDDDALEALAFFNIQ